MDRTDLEKQIEKAKRLRESWPRWMKDNDYFVGTDNAPLPDEAEDHAIEG